MILDCSTSEPVFFVDVCYIFQGRKCSYFHFVWIEKTVLLSLMSRVIFIFSVLLCFAWP